MMTFGSLARACINSNRSSDGGELIIYAPHVREISVTHGKGHQGDRLSLPRYFCNNGTVQASPVGVIAHSTHVRGIGVMENGVEKCRVRVTLATGIPETVCHRINLGYRDPRTIRGEDFANREREGVLFVPKAGEMLYRLRNPPPWQASNGG
jgi:hypothetical protein